VGLTLIMSKGAAIELSGHWRGAGGHIVKRRDRIHERCSELGDPRGGSKRAVQKELPVKRWRSQGNRRGRVVCDVELVGGKSGYKNAIMEAELMQGGRRSRMTPMALVGVRRGWCDGGRAAKKVSLETVMSAGGSGVSARKVNWQARARDKRHVAMMSGRTNLKRGSYVNVAG